MRKALSLMLTFISIISLAGCSKTIDSSEVYSFPESTYQIKVSHFISGEVKDYFLGAEEYEAENNVLLPIFEWYNSLELVEIVINEGELTPNMEVTGGESYSFTVDDELAFIYFDLAPNSYIMTSDDKWYEVEKPTSPDIGSIHTYQ